ncbi:MAG: DUF2786 domain-containing protein [Nitratireductor sp.]|nr:DUF2786 domain-containing protein [Nitratireductor sp.]
MTAARGCTEAEALAAAEKAAQLMRDHGISETDIKIEEASSRSRQGGRGQKARLWPVIAHCTNTASIVVRSRFGNDVTFVGREPGPEIAVYLRDVCERAIDRELARFKTTPAYRRKRSVAVKRQVAAAFVGGMVTRLSGRLLEIFGPAVSEADGAEANRALAERYPGSIDLPKAKRELRHSMARAAGFLAGENVTLAHGVGGSDTPLAIGDRS